VDLLSDGDVIGKHNPNSRNTDFWVVKLNSLHYPVAKKAWAAATPIGHNSIQQTDDEGIL